MQKLTARRWTIPLLAELGPTDGAKFVSLTFRLGCTQPALRASLDHAIALGLCRPNPGYGHPMRPEYVLTELGTLVAPAALELWDLARERGWTGSLFRKWSPQTVLWVARGNHGFALLRDALPATDRALSMTLKVLVADGVLARTVVEDYPPRTLYGLTPDAERLIAPLEALDDLALGLG